MQDVPKNVVQEENKVSYQEPCSESIQAHTCHHTKDLQQPLTRRGHEEDNRFLPHRIQEETIHRSCTDDDLTAPEKLREVQALTVERCCRFTRAWLLSDCKSSGRRVGRGLI